MIRWWRATALVVFLLATLDVTGAAFAKDDPDWGHPDLANSDLARFAYTADFLQGTTFYDYCIGIACQPTPPFAAARRAARDGDAVVPYLLARYDGAPPAAQLYIALVVRVHDRAKGAALLRQLAARHGETVKVFSGCILAPQRLDALAGNYLKQTDFKFD